MIVAKDFIDKIILIPIVIIKKENIIPRNMQSFLFENKNAAPLYIKSPTADKVVDGEVLYDILSNIT